MFEDGYCMINHDKALLKSEESDTPFMKQTICSYLSNLNGILQSINDS